jgi:DNA repair protein RecO (recombination protein O)
VGWQRVYVLHLRHFSDSRYWVDLLTQKSGKVCVIWRKNKKTTALVPFTPYQAEWTNRGTFKILSACESVGSPISLEGSALFCGFYINELCERLLLVDDDSHVPFKAYENALLHLASTKGLEQPLRAFEWQLICHLGFEFSFTLEGYSNSPILSANWYRFDPSFGFELVGIQPNTGFYLGAHLLSIGRGEMDTNLARILKSILRRALQHKLGFKPLKSREYFR